MIWDELKEALLLQDDIEQCALTLSGSEWLVSPIQTVFDAARMVVAGQPLWWCEEHDSPASAKTNGACVVAVLATRRNPCRMVEGWWSPTGKDET